MTYQKTLAVLLQVVVFVLSASCGTAEVFASETLSARPELAKSNQVHQSDSLAFAGQVSVVSQGAPASTQTQPESEADLASEIVDLTNQLLLKEIDFERYYIQYRIDGSKEPKYRRLRFFLLQQAAGSGALASNIINTVECGSHLGTPEQTSSAVFKASGRLGLTTTILGGTASGIELGANGLIALKNKWNHEDAASARQNAIDRLHEIDSLADRRDALIRRFHDGEAHEIFVQEGKLLRTFRQWCIYEFSDVYSDTKSYQASANVFYVADIAAYSTAYVSYLQALRAFTNTRRSAAAVHNGVVCDSLFTVEAPATAVAYKQFYNDAWKRISADLKCTPKDVEADAKQQMVQLEHLAAMADESTIGQVGHIASRLAVYSFWSTRYDKYIDKRMADMRRVSKIALQSTVSGPLLGATGLAQDIFNEFGVYRYRNSPFRANSLAFAGAATSTLGGLASVTLTGWWFADELRYQRDAARKNVLPRQLMQDRLRTLETLTDMLGKAK